MRLGNISGRRIGILVCVLILLLSACGKRVSENLVKPPRTVALINELGEIDLLVIGKIEVIPPIVPLEQSTLAETYRNKVTLVFRDELKHLRQLSRYDRKGQVTVSLAEQFYVAVPDTMNYFLGTTIPMRAQKQRGKSQPEIVNAKLPAAMYMVARRQDRAIYIGTIRYFRDEFFDIYNVEIVDEFKQARQEFEKKFGTNVPLKKSLLQNPDMEKRQPGKDKRIQTSWAQGSY